ncbi:hypothetical protein [Blastococcus sp. SYSU D01042]
MSTATAQRRPGTPAQGPPCAYRPHPASGPPPSCWTSRASHRERLEFAFALLRRYGIAAVPAIGEDADPTHRLLADRLATLLPHGAGSYVFWTATDDDRCLGQDGELTADLPLHHPPHLALAVAAVLDEVALPHAAAPDGRTTSVTGGGRRAAGRRG